MKKARQEWRRTSGRLMFFVLACFLSVCVAPVFAGRVWPPPSKQELARKADLIIVGQIVSKQTEHNVQQKTTNTYFEVQVEGVLKGQPQMAVDRTPINVRKEEMDVGSDSGLWAADSDINPEKGDRMFLFLVKDSQGHPTQAGGQEQYVGLSFRQMNEGMIIGSGLSVEQYCRSIRDLLGRPAVSASSGGAKQQAKEAAAKEQEGKGVTESTPAPEIIPYGEHVVTVGQRLVFRDFALIVAENIVQDGRSFANFLFADQPNDIEMLGEGDSRFADLSFLGGSFAKTDGIIVTVQHIANDRITAVFKAYHGKQVTLQTAAGTLVTLHLGDVLSLPTGTLQVEGISNCFTGTAVFYQGDEKVGSSIPLLHGMPISYPQLQEAQLGPIRILPDGIAFEARLR